MAKNKTDAVNYILIHGLNDTRELIKGKQREKELLEIYLKNGLPDLHSSL